MVDIAADSNSGLDTNTGADWANAVKTLTYALSLAAAGDKIWLRNSAGGGFLESVAVDTVLTGSLVEGDAPVYIIGCKNTATNWPTQEADVVSGRSDTDVANLDTGANNVTLELKGMLVTFGLSLKSGSNIALSTGGPVQLCYEEGTLEVGSVATGGRSIQIGTTGPVGEMSAKLINVNVNNTASNDSILLIGRGAKVEWVGGGITGTASPAYLIQSTEGGVFRGIALDLSKATDTGVNVSTAEGSCDIHFSECKLNVALTKVSANVLNMAPGRIIYHNCSDVNEKNQFFAWEHGTQVVNDKATYLTAAFDSESYSMKIVTDANNAWGKHYRFAAITLIVDLSTAKTFTVEITCANLLTDKDVWIEAEYADDLSTLGFLQSTRAKNLASTAVNHPTSTAAWTVPLANKQKIALTPANAGKKALMTLFVCVAKPSEIVNVCPNVIIT